SHPTSLRVFGTLHERLVDRREPLLDPIEDLCPSIVIEFLDARKALETGVQILVLLTDLVGGVSFRSEQAKPVELHVPHHSALVSLAKVILERRAQLMVLDDGRQRLSRSIVGRVDARLVDSAELFRNAAVNRAEGLFGTGIFGII